MIKSALLAGRLSVLSLGFSHAASDVFRPEGPELAVLCMGDARASAGGVLIWNVAEDRDSHDAPYQIICPDFTISNDGQTLSVQAGSLDQALKRVDPDASFLAYFADLMLRFPEPGTVSADSRDSVPEVVAFDVDRVNVTVSQPGHADRGLITNGQITPLTYDPALPLTLHLRADVSPIDWPEVAVEADKGRITASLPRYEPVVAGLVPGTINTVQSRA